jgi:hypothetical protein
MIFNQKTTVSPFPSSGAVGGKTGKTSVLPRFSKIERGGGSGGATEASTFN